MTPQRLLTLIFVAIVAVGAGVWLAGRQSSSGTTKAALLYPQLKQHLDAVNAVRVYRAGDARVVELVRKDSGWTVSERDGYPADESKLRKLLIAIADAKVYEEKTSNPDQYANLGVADTKDAKAAGERIELAGTEQPVNLIVGKPGMGARSHYVRRAGEARSWLIDTTIDTSSTPDAWLRKEILDVGADRIQSATVALPKAKSYTAAKQSRADANFSVAAIPKGKSLSSPSAANGFATALTALTLSDVQPAQAFTSTPPDAHATFKTFDGLVVDVDGWKKEQKHYIAVRTAFDAAQAERFKAAAAALEEKKDGKPEPARQEDTAAPATPAKPATPPKANVEEDAKTAAAKLAGWIYEVPEYKYDNLFKQIDQLLK